MHPNPHYRVQPRRSGTLANRPFIICCLYLATFFTVITSIVGIVLLYIFRSEPHEEWEATHYQYLIRTFWIGVFGVLSFVCGLILFITENIAGAVLLALALIISIQIVVRTILSMVKALDNRAIPKPRTVLF